MNKPNQMNKNQIGESVTIEENSQNLKVNGINNRISVESNKRKISLNGINNSLHVKVNLGIVVVNGFGNSIVIDQDFTGIVQKNGFRNKVQKNTTLTVVKERRLAEGRKLMEEEMDNCPICFEKYHLTDEDAHEMPCGHFMHDFCFEEYCECFDKCPLCKQPFDQIEDN